MLNRVRLKSSYVIAIVLVLLSMALSSAADRPNVILIVTDDQGYGDIGFHGNSMIQTPQLDQLARQSLRFTNFHVDPTCAETRSALMTGKYSCRVGVWHTIMGRSILRSDEKIMPRHFADAGYQTGHFGKWHLGDNWPYRPHDRGFRETLYLGGGGVGQSADHWGNDYFDDTFRRNGNPEPQQGYCTDVFFQAALKFIEAQQHQPFYCYIATNAPHSPYNVDPKYAQPYLDKGVAQPMANFYGMIANIDENIGRLRQKLDEWNLADNTILIFMTDNGTAAGVVNTLNASGRSKKKNPAPKNLEGKWTGYAAGMRAQKGSQYEGGHRVPCYIRWPASKWTHDREIAPLAAHFDLLPTLAEACQLGPIESGTLDGRSLVPLLRGDKQEKETRTIVVHSQRVDFPEKWRKSVVIQGTWRLVDGKELFDLSNDPAQAQDIATRHPQTVADLRKFYDGWWDSVSSRFNEYSDIPIGAVEANPVELCCHDWHPVANSMPWSQSAQEGVKADPEANGTWAIAVKKAGRYAFTLRARPAGVPYQLTEGVARVKVNDIEATGPIPSGTESVTVTLDLPPTNHAMLQTWLESSGRSRGAYYVSVNRLE